MSGPAAHPMRAPGLRVFIRAGDAACYAELRDLMVDAGHAVVSSIDEADVVLSDLRTIDLLPRGFAMLNDASLATLLTPREIEVLNAIGEGLTNKMIARQLDISLHTVKYHVEALFRKLNVRTRAEAVMKARSYRSEAIEL